MPRESLLNLGSKLISLKIRLGKKVLNRLLKKLCFEKLTLKIIGGFA